MEDPRVDPWWKQPIKEGDAGPHVRLFELVRRLDNEQKHIYNTDLDRLRLYSGRRYDGLKPGDMRAKDYVDDSENVPQDYRPLPLHMNVTRSVVDTAHANICTNRPRMQVLTEGGSWHEQQKARGMQRFLDGIMDACDAYTHNAKAAMDGKIFGCGWTKVFVENKELKVEWVWKPEVFVDEQACLTSEPRQIYQRKYMASEAVSGKWELSTEVAALVESNVVPQDVRSNASIITSLVEVVEGWHLPSGPKSKDGRHVVCVGNYTIVDEEYKEPVFPLVKWEWGDDPVPFFKPGLVEEIEAMQKDIDETIQKVQRHMLMIGPWFEVDPGADVPEGWMSNEEFRVLPPGVNVKVPQVIPPIFVDWPFMIEQKMYDLPGISTMDARGGQPPGDLSGKALRHLSALSTKRGGMKERNGWENPTLREAKLVLRFLRRFGNKLTVHYSDRDKLEKIKWSEVKLPEESYRLAIFPTNMLPKEPAGKIAFVQELVGMGWLDPALGSQLLDMPDLDSAQSIKVAAIKHVQWILDELVYQGNYHEPDPIMDLDTGLVWARGTYLYCQQHGAPQEILTELGQWIGQCKAALMQRAIDEAVDQAKVQQAIQAATAPPPPPEGMMPPGGEMPPEGMMPPGDPGLGGPPGGELPIDETAVPEPLASGGAGLPPDTV